MPEELQELGLKVVRTHKYKATTDSAHNLNVALNLLDQDFTTTGPNQKWARDISYIWTQEGWLYLAIIIDLYSRRVVGWAVSNARSRWTYPIDGYRYDNNLAIGFSEFFANDPENRSGSIGRSSYIGI